MKSQPLLKATNLSHHFDYPLYNNLNFSLKAKESMAILGVSGSGKSTILNHLSTMLKPNHGQIDLLGISDIYSQPKDKLLEIRRYDLGIIFQSHYLFAGFSALENLKVASLLTDKMIDTRLLEKLDVNHVLSQSVGSLSGGQQQRLSIARVLCKQPKIIFADEPTGNLDSKTANIVMESIFEYIKENDAALVLVTHDESIAKKCKFTYHLINQQLESI